MRVSVLQDQLARGLGIVSRAVDSRPTMPVMANVALATDDSQLRLAAINDKMSITTYIGAKVDEAGAITLPAKTLNELVNNLSQEHVDLRLDDKTQTVNVRCGMTVSNIRGISADEFPLIPDSGDPDVLVPGQTLREMINQTVFAAAREETRPILTGVYTHFDGPTLTLAAADGYRLAVRTAQLEHSIEGSAELVVPAKALVEVARIIADDDTVGITLPGERALVLFYTQNTVISSQLLDGKFPDFGAIIPKRYTTSTVVYTSDLLRACKRAEIFARDSNYSARIVVQPATAPNEPGEVRVTGKSAERGDNEGMVDASVEGEAIEVAFNIRYLIDVLSVIDDERVIIESMGAASPGVLRLEDRDDFIHVIMPMSVTK
ncbi:MAG: DNA polymerase III subunit beta [Chloroflexi bacterium]|nr:DNA polymerase III subunit beta [Chloroflexota bacterium]